MSFLRYSSWIALFLVCSACSKSGDLPTAPVTGKVTYKGEPVKSGTVLFVPDQGPAATGEIKADGTYSLMTYQANDGAVLGSHKVAITALQDMGDALPEQQSGTPKPTIPEKYLSHDTSGLVAEVKAEGNQVNFELTD